MENGTSVNAETVHRWLQGAAESLSENRDYLTQLDAAIGDADHGANMDRGFTAVAEMADAILGDLDPPAGSNLLAFVNGLGGTPLIELYLVYNELAKQLGTRGLTAARSLVGNYITSLEMAGVSITLLVLDDELTALWDAPVHTPALRWGV